LIKRFGKIKDAACINVGEQLFQRSTAKIFMAYDCGTWTFLQTCIHNKICYNIQWTQTTRARIGCLM